MEERNGNRHWPLSAVFCPKSLAGVYETLELGRPNLLLKNS